jgi:pilus assembly protein CpaB
MCRFGRGNQGAESHWMRNRQHVERLKTRSTMKSKSVFLIAISLGFGLVAAIGISQVMGRNGGNGDTTVKTRAVVLAKETLDAMTELTPELVTIEQWPENIVPEGVATNLDELTNKIIRSRVGKGFPIYSQELVDKNEANRLAIPKGSRVVAIKLEAEDVICGILQPGDMVDIIGVFGKGREGSLAKTFLRKIRIHSIDGNTIANIKRDSTTKSDTIVGVLVNQKQAEQIAHVQSVAQLKLSLRDPNSDDEDDNVVEDVAQLNPNGLGGGQASAGGQALASTFGTFMKKLMEGRQAATDQTNIASASFLTRVYTSDGIQVYRFGAAGSLPVRTDALTFGASSQDAGGEMPAGRAEVDE